MEPVSIQKLVWLRTVMLIRFIMLANTSCSEVLKRVKKNHLDTAVGGFNPSEKYYSQIGSNWIISLGSGENNLKSPPSHLLAKLPRFIIPINGAPQKWRRSRVNSLAAVQPRGETRQKLGHLDGHGGWYWNDASVVVVLREKWWWWHQVVKVK